MAQPCALVDREAATAAAALVGVRVRSCATGKVGRTPRCRQWQGGRASLKRLSGREHDFCLIKAILMFWIAIVAHAFKYNARRA